MFACVIRDPSKEIVPESGAVSPMMSRSNVDLPQPLGPINTVVLLRSTVRFVECSAGAPS